MTIRKRIISYLLIISIISALFVPVAVAAETTDYRTVNFDVASAVNSLEKNSEIFSNALGHLATLYEAMTSGVCSGCPTSLDGNHNFLPQNVLVTSWLAALKGSEAVVCRYCGVSYSDFYDSTYNNYVTDLQGDFGSSLYRDGCWWFPIKPDRINVSYDGNGLHEPVLTDTGFSLTGRYKNSGRISVYFNDFVSPITGEYNMYFKPSSLVNVDYWVFSGFGSTPGDPNTSYKSGAVNAGQSITMRQLICHVADLGYNVTFAGSVYVSVKPIDFVDDVNSRPTTLIADYGIIGDNGTIIHVEGDKIVDESTNVFYNPVTNLTLNFTDWAYDYATRSYTLTLEDGTNVTVEFGNENITINEGDTVYNVYYVLPSEDDPGADPDDPSAPDAPSTNDGSGWAWWKEAWQSFTDRFFGLFGDSDSDIDQTFPGEEDDPTTEEDDGWSILDLFRLLRDALWKVITGILNTALNGFLGLVNAISSIGDFFTVFDRNTEGGVLDILNQGGSAVWE